MPPIPRRHAIALLGTTVSGAALAQMLMWLFDVTRTGDRLTVGLTNAALDRLGPGDPRDRLRRYLAERGEVTLWRYAIRRHPAGGERYMPEDRVTLRRDEVLRIEINPTARVVMPPEEDLP